MQRILTRLSCTNRQVVDDELARPEQNSEAQRRVTSLARARENGLPMGCYTKVSSANKHQISEKRFASFSNEKKIEWLRRAVPQLPNNLSPCESPIMVGARRMNRKSALCFALEYSIKSKRGAVAAISRQLTGEYPADEARFSVFGVPFDGIRLRDWARSGIDQGIPGPPPPEMINDLGKSIHKNNSENVHDSRVKAFLLAQIECIRDRVPASDRISEQQAETEITAFLQTTCLSSKALSGMKRVTERSDTVDDFKDNVRAHLGILWNYIRSMPDQPTQELIKASLATKLREIHDEAPCGTGMITRLVDVPTAIDWSLTTHISQEHLQEELRTLAGAVNESCGTDPDLADQARTFASIKQLAVGSVTNDEFETQKLIRERFLHMADVEFGMLRGMDRSLVRREAVRVFPENAL